MNESNKSRSAHRVLAGLLIITAGVLLFMQRSGAYIPTWVFSWPMLLIAIGLVSAVKHRFHNLFGFMLMLIGGAFLAYRIAPLDLEISRFIVPALVVMLGLAVIFKPKRHHHHWKHCEERYRQGRQTWEWVDEKKKADGDSVLDETAVFGGIRKTVLSKEFKGGELVSVFGGMEVDLSQADINGNAILDVTVVFGGLRLVVPPHWDVKTQVTNVAAGVDDKRNTNSAIDHTKVLTITGEAVCGGIDIRSY